LCFCWLIYRLKNLFILLYLLFVESQSVVKDQSCLKSGMDRLATGKPPHKDTSKFRSLCLWAFCYIGHFRQDPKEGGEMD
jgi:hypothetical protein